MKKEIYIHVGAGKTGTTAIQEFLFLNEKRLLESGIYIPVIGRSLSKSAIAHHELAAYDFIHNKKNFDEVIRLWKQLVKKKNSKILLTSENFHSLIKLHGGLDYLLKIKDILSDFNVYVVFYMRREDEWLQSAYIQWVKSGGLRNGIRICDFIKQKRVSLPEQVLVFAKIFGNDSIIVRPFEKEQFYGGNIFSDFLNIFGVELSDDYILPEKNSNPGITPDALEFKRIYNTVCKNRQEAQMLMNPLLAYSELVDSNNTKIFKKNNLLSKDERDNILNPLLPLYSKIAKDFLKREEGILFYDLDTNFDSVNSGKNDTSKVIAYLIKELFKENISLRNEIDVLKKELKK